VAGRIGHQPDHEKGCGCGCSASRDQRQLDAGDGQQPDHVADVDEHLADHPDGRGRSQQPQERIGRAPGDPHAGVGEHPEEGQQPGSADEAQFLADDREDEVIVGVGQVVPLGGALAESVAEHPAVGQRELGLPRLVAGSLSIGVGSQPRLNPVGAVARRDGQDRGGAHRRQQ
jgi:hypothetical protein